MFNKLETNSLGVVDWFWVSRQNKLLVRQVAGFWVSGPPIETADYWISVPHVLVSKSLEGCRLGLDKSQWEGVGPRGDECL